LKSPLLLLVHDTRPGRKSSSPPTGMTTRSSTRFWTASSTGFSMDAESVTARNDAIAECIPTKLHASSSPCESLKPPRSPGIQDQTLTGQETGPAARLADVEEPRCEKVVAVACRRDRAIDAGRSQAERRPRPTRSHVKNAILTVFAPWEHRLQEPSKPTALPSSKSPSPSPPLPSSQPPEPLTEPETTAPPTVAEQATTLAPSSPGTTLSMRVCAAVSLKKAPDRLQPPGCRQPRRHRNGRRGGRQARRARRAADPDVQQRAAAHAARSEAMEHETTAEAPKANKRIYTLDQLRSLRPDSTCSSTFDAAAIIFVPHHHRYSCYARAVRLGLADQLPCMHRAVPAASLAATAMRAHVHASLL